MRLLLRRHLLKTRLRKKLRRLIPQKKRLLSPKKRLRTAKMLMPLKLRPALRLWLRSSAKRSNTIMTLKKIRKMHPKIRLTMRRLMIPKILTKL